MADACFQIKGTSVTTMVLDLYEFNPPVFRQQLREKVDKAPSFFRESPIFINLTAFSGELQSAQLDDIIGFCRELGFQPFACKGAPDSLLPAIKQHGLLILPQTKVRSERKTEIDGPTNATVNSVDVLPSKVISKPVRSGQQVYAEGSDLILLAPVSEGAEVIADGNIHVYSVLRGRALAGVKDNPHARIFCQQLEAELVSIAGHFILNDKLREQCWKKPAQVFLENESIQVAAL
ncbi:MAG TPA: septum site-determining protein MinC [Cellvibrionaceae bacterium]